MMIWTPWSFAQNTQEQGTREESEIDYDFLDDTFDPPANSIYDPTPQAQPGDQTEESPLSPQSEPRSSSSSSWSFGHSEEITPRLDTLVVSIEPQRLIEYYTLNIRLVDFEGTPMPHVKTTFLGTAFGRRSQVEIFSNSQGVLQLLDFPEHTYALYTTGNEINQDPPLFFPMSHEVYAPTFDQLSQQRGSDSPELTIDHLQIRSSTFNRWMEDTGLRAQDNLGHVCGEVRSSIISDLSGYMVSVFDHLRPLRLMIENTQIQSGDSPTVRPDTHTPYRVYYFNESGELDPTLTQTSTTGRYCLFNLSPTTLRLNIKSKIQDHFHTLTHNITITPGHMSYVTSHDRLGKVGLIRYVVAPPSDNLLTAYLPVASPLELSGGNPNLSWNTFNIANIAQALYAGISDQTNLTNWIETESTFSSNGSQRAIKGLVQSWLHRWWNNENQSMTLPPSSTLYSQIFAPHDHQTIWVSIDDAHWDRTLHRISESVWYGIRPLMLLRKDTLSKIATEAGITYEPTASHLFVEHRFREEEASIHVAPELWSDQGELINPSLVQRSWEMLRLIYYNLDPDRYQWVLKTKEGQWRASKVIHTESNYISVIESGRDYQLGEGLPFQGQSPLRPPRRSTSSQSQPDPRPQSILVPVPGSTD